MSLDNNTRALIEQADEFLYEHRQQLNDLLCELVAIDSQIPPYANERRIADFLVRRMDSLGFDTETIARNPDRPNLVARLAGRSEGRSLMLNGHLDTKPVGDTLPLWKSDPLTPEIRNERLYGLGACDMKGAVAAMVFAAAAFGASGAPKSRGDLVLGFVSDEEAGGTFGAQYLAPRLSDVSACLIGEPSGWDHNWQGLHLVSRGVCCFRLRVRGTQMHSSLSDRIPCVNASQQMARLLLALNEELSFSSCRHFPGGVTPTLNAGVLVSGGVYFGVIPGIAEFGCDLRTLPGMTLEAVTWSLETWLAEQHSEHPDLDAELVFEPALTWVPPSEIAPTHPLVADASASALEVLDIAPPLSVFPGGTDAPWFELAGIPTVPSFGPGILTCAHGPNEFLELDALFEAARIYVRVAIRYCAEGS